MGGSSQTFSSIQVSPILGKGTATAAFKREAKLKSKGSNAAVYAAVYVSAKKKYRKSYSANQLRTLGYSPSTTAMSSKVNESAALPYIQAHVDATAHTLSRLSVGYATEEQVAAYYISRNLVVWNNETRQYTKPTGEVYDLVNVIARNSSISENVWNDLQGEPFITGVLTTTTVYIDISLIQDAIQVVEKNLVDFYSYNGTTVLVGGEEYSVATIGTTLIGGNYEVLCSREVEITPAIPDDPATTEVDESVPAEVKIVYTTIYVDPVYLAYSYNGSTLYKAQQQSFVSNSEHFVKSYVTGGNNILSTYIAYINSSGSDAKVYIEAGAIPTIVTTSTTAMTAIVPLKVNNIINPEDGNMTKMLDYLGLTRGSFDETLNSSDLDSAYVFYGIPLGTTDPGCHEALYKTFDLYVDGKYTVSSTSISLEYKYTIAKSVHTGVTATIGKYTMALESITTVVPGDTGTGMESTETTVDNIILRKQISATEYKEIYVGSFGQTYNVSGQKFTYGQDIKGTSSVSDVLEARIIVPLSVLKSLKYNAFAAVHEESLSFLMFATETITGKWYTSFIFKFIISMVALVLAATTGQLWLIVATFVAIAIPYVLPYIFDALNIPQEWRGAITAVITVVLIWFGGVGGGLDLVLQVVNTGTALMNAYTSYQIAMAQQESIEASEDQEARTKRMDALAEANGVLGNSGDISAYSFDTDFAMRPADTLTSTENWIYRLIEYPINQPNTLFNIDSDMQRKIQVYAGV